jgi:hypothetical protein
LVPFKVVGPNGAVIVDSGLVDSGADSSAFPLWMMKRFRIFKNQCKKEKFETSGGEGVQWIYPENLKATIFGRDLELTAIFTETPIALLGREDFFSAFRVVFDERALTLTIDPY